MGRFVSSAIHVLSVSFLFRKVDNSNTYVFFPYFQTNTYWTLSGSPYVVRDRINVIHSATLNIQAGVDVVFVGSQAGLVIEGNSSC